MSFLNYFFYKKKYKKENACYICDNVLRLLLTFRNNELFTYFLAARKKLYENQSFSCN